MSLLEFQRVGMERKLHEINVVQQKDFSSIDESGDGQISKVDSPLIDL